MNLLKNKFRPSLQEESTCDFLMCIMTDPKVIQFDPPKAVDQQYNTLVLELQLCTAT
jgi:hypothetical protein